ncbi:MAG: energy-coupling factor ABC transporter permease [Rhizobium sp.]|uniref:energy-coupling factor ABC transporter permease n=1 Tax=Rhizobium sp. R86522 TaxID=3093861 RepID=UPI0026113099|nr:energy-coupling factor ABC transporter permease [Rhizobium sp.]MDM8016109.1 energy-coupling factor ABC transporter permease [Rhizobium sp.]
MHIEPGVVDGAKLAFSYATAALSFGLIGKMVVDDLKAKATPTGLAARTLITTALVFSFFEVLPHHPVGVSEVHLILGSTLFLIFGAGAASIGLALGLLLQGLFFAPFDLPQYGMNVTTLIVPLFVISQLAARLISEKKAYVDVGYKDALALSTAYQGGIVAWVAFWALYGNGFSAESLSSIATFGAAYMMVILVEPLVDLAVLAAAKSLRQATDNGLFNGRLHRAAV